MLSPHEKHNFRLGVTCTDVFFIHKNKLNIHYWNDMCNVYTLRNRKIYISNMKLILIHILLFLAKKTLNMQNNLRLIGLTGLMGSLDYVRCGTADVIIHSRSPPNLRGRLTRSLVPEPYKGRFTCSRWPRQPRLLEP